MARLISHIHHTSEYRQYCHVGNYGAPLPFRTAKDVASWRARQRLLGKSSHHQRHRTDSSPFKSASCQRSQANTSPFNIITITKKNRRLPRSRAQYLHTALCCRRSCARDERSSTTLPADPTPPPQPCAQETVHRTSSSPSHPQDTVKFLFNRASSMQYVTAAVWRCFDVSRCVVWQWLGIWVA